MQATKDSFYMTLRGRLAQVYPARTITVDGVTRPALVVVENDKPSVSARQHDAFYMDWGEAHAVRPAISGLMAMMCTISYASAGTDQNGGLDRGRALGELESELLGICTPSVARKCDCTGANPVDLGSSIFWTTPGFRAMKADPNCVAREASLKVYFYPEVTQA
ncbi:MAG TPA: hypothetical protein VE779_09450 [Candidatus Angelobacter sp.]|nr:hypothetical protein [Candidatus Angelobacter sp.]